MSDDTPRLERFLEGAARLATGGGLHPLVVLQEVQTAAIGSVHDGVVANGYRIELAAADLQHLGNDIGRLREAIVAALGELKEARALRTLDAWRLEFTTGRLMSGEVRVRTSFTNPSQTSVPHPAGATSVITRHRGRSIHIQGQGAVALTHTPFTIGRGRDCDLVIIDFAVSRQHARIESLPGGGLVIRDLGSRNRLVVDGEPCAEVELRPGLQVTLGATTLWLEEAPQ